MQAKTKTLTAAVVAAGLLLTLGGCIQPAVLTGASKVANNQLSALTASEILALASTANSMDASLDLNITREQAQAISTFLSANNINSPDQFEGIAEQFLSNPTSVQIPSGVLELFLNEYENTDATPRTSNQGGGSLVSAVSKLSEGQISTWTPDEVQIVADTISEVDEEAEDIDITDEQATAIVEFLQANDIDTVAEGEAVTEQAEADPDSVVLPEGAEELFDNL